MSRRRTRRQNRAAFTLMEVLLVLVILVVLGSLAVGMFTGAQRKASINAAKTQVNMIDSQGQRFNLDMGRFPQDFSELLVDPGVASWGGPYLTREVPADPWGNPYQMQSPGTRHPHKCDIWSYGPNGQNGDEDDIYND